MFVSTRRRVLLSRRKQFVASEARRLNSLWVRSVMASADYQRSVSEVQQSVAEARQPDAETEQPGAEVQQPDAEVQQPSAEVGQPSAEVHQPSRAAARETPARGKPPTRGRLQILKENADTTKTYTYVAIGTTGFRWLVNILFAVAFDVSKIYDLSFLNVIADYVIPSLLILLCFIMKRISRPLYSDAPRRKLISPGYDLNMDYGLGEHLKDVILVLVVTYTLTLIHDLFFFTLLLLPIRLVYFLYVYVVEPYLALNPEGEPRRSNHLLHAICVVIVMGYVLAFLYPNLHPFFN